MTIKERIAAWYIVGRIAKAAGVTRRQLRKGIDMKPLPKWIAWIGNLTAIGSVLGAVGNALPPKYAAIAAAIAALINSVSHSLPGTGGK